MTFNLAYLDAGTGSLLRQAVLGGLAGIGVLYKTLWQRVGRNRHDIESTEGEPTATADQAGD